MGEYFKLGTHSVLYYYGIEHLLVNIYSYIQEAIQNNELIFISMEKRLYDPLLKHLIEWKIDEEKIKFRSVKYMILSYKEGGIEGLKKKVKNLKLEAIEKGYRGIRWIGQPTYAIQETSREDFLNWERVLSEALADTKISIICIYDCYDYIYNRNYIDEVVIMNSLNTHTHIWSKSFLRNLVKDKKSHDIKGE